MIGGKVKRILLAALLLTIAPFRAVVLSIYGLCRCKPKRCVEGEIVLVTGAAQGLGRGISIEFAKLGATVVCWDVNEKGCQQTIKLAKEASGGKAAVFSYVCDISNRNEVQSVAQLVQNEVGDVTILINNAAIVTADRMDKYTPEEIVRVVNTNFTSHFWMLEAFLPFMKSVNKGQIVCVSSMSSILPIEFLVPYAATKCGITGLMDGLNEELICLGYDNIKVTTVHPFFVATPKLMETINHHNKSNGNSETRPEVLSSSSVVMDLVDGVLHEKREFSIPSHMMGLMAFIKLYPKDVVRACRQIYTHDWRTLFGEEGKYVK